MTSVMDMSLSTQEGWRNMLQMTRIPEIAKRLAQRNEAANRMAYLHEQMEHRCIIILFPTERRLFMRQRIRTFTPLYIAFHMRKKDP